MSTARSSLITKVVATVTILAVMVFCFIVHEAKDLTAVMMTSARNGRIVLSGKMFSDQMQHQTSAFSSQVANEETDIGLKTWKSGSDMMNSTASSLSAPSLSSMHSSWGDLIPPALVSLQGTSKEPAKGGGAIVRDQSCKPSCPPGTGWSSASAPAQPASVPEIVFQSGLEAGSLRAKKGGCFGVLAVCQLEEHVLVEWLEHHYSEGATHIYLGNNNPPGTVEYDIFRRQIQPYEKAGLLTWWQMPSLPQNIPFKKRVNWLNMVYNSMALPRIKKDGFIEWLLIVDMDEFAYSHPREGTMGKYLCGKVPPQVTQLCIPYNFYGNSGFEKQPACIAPNFIMRTTSQSKIHGKCVSRIANTSFYSVHYHQVSGGDNYIAGSPWQKYSKKLGGKSDERLKFWSVSEKTWDEWPLRLNHYQMQSVQHFRVLRNNRSQATSVSSQAVDTSGQAVKAWDKDATADRLMMSKGHWKKLWWDCNRTEGPVEWARFNT